MCWWVVSRIVLGSVLLYLLHLCMMVRSHWHLIMSDAGDRGVRSVW